MHQMRSYLNETIISRSSGNYIGLRSHLPFYNRPKPLIYTGSDVIGTGRVLATESNFVISNGVRNLVLQHPE
jgi:hypothetical protein